MSTLHPHSLINFKPNNFLLGFFLISMLNFTHHGFSQKIIEKTWEGEAFDRIEIISNEVFKIEIMVGDFSEIKLQTKISGENAENMNIGASEKSKVLSLKPSYRPYFIPQNDKLAAHKVISIEMKLYLPEQKSVFIDSNLASLEATGSFLTLEVNLRDGYCLLKEFSGNGVLNTLLGNITVFAKSNVSGEAISRNGSVINQLSTQEINTLKVESVNGNISLLKSPE